MGSNSHWNDAGEVVETEGFGGWGDNRQKFLPHAKGVDPRDAERCCGRLEENLRLVERGRLVMPVGADLGLFLLTDGKLNRNVEITNACM